MEESYYELLGVSSDATPEEIKRAYRTQLKETHPDVSDDENASERTKRLIAAKETLSDEAERAEYDRLGHASYTERSASGVGDTTPGSSPAGQAATSHSGTASGPGAGRRSAQSTAADAGSAGSAGNRRDGSASATGADKGQTTATGTARTASTQSGGATGTAGGRGRRHGRSDQWSETASTREGQRQNSWRAWDTEGSYAVRRGGDGLPGSGIFSTQQALLVFAATLAVYPVLLFGALHGTFPVFVNVSVAMCAVLVVAFLQSVPLAGVGVFGFWTLFVPPLILFQFDVGFLTPVGVLATAGVAFPFGLSMLTWRFAGPGRVD